MSCNPMLTIGSSEKKRCESIPRCTGKKKKAPYVPKLCSVFFMGFGEMMGTPLHPSPTRIVSGPAMTFSKADTVKLNGRCGFLLPQN